MPWLEMLRTKLGPTLTTCLCALQAGGFIIWFQDYIGLESMVISGPSMLPTFNKPRLAGDIVLVEGFSSWFPHWIASSTFLSESLKHWIIHYSPKIQKGDVVLAYSPMQLNKRICKRLVALPGDIIRIPLDGSPLEGQTIIIPKGHAWLEGDCPQVSRDCRDYGPIPIALIHGRPWFQIWPYWSVGWIKKKRNNR